MPGRGKRFQPGNPGGPGRPRGPGRDYLRLLAEELTPEKWLSIVRKAIEQAESGDTAARAWLSKHVLGEEPYELGLLRQKFETYVKEWERRERGDEEPGSREGRQVTVPLPAPGGEQAAAPKPGQPGGSQAASAGDGAGTGAGGQPPGAAGAATHTAGTPAEPALRRGLFGLRRSLVQPPPAAPAPQAGPDGPRPGGAAASPPGRS